MPVATVWQRLTHVGTFVLPTNALLVAVHVYQALYVTSHVAPLPSISETLSHFILQKVGRRVLVAVVGDGGGY